jgi:hypothetical protein
LRAEYRLVEIVDKGQANRNLNEIPEVVRLLLSDEDDCMRARLETWLMHAERQWLRYAFDRQIPAERQAQAREEHQAADIAVRYGPIEEAAALVRAFCANWIPRGKGT